MQSVYLPPNNLFLMSLPTFSFIIVEYKSLESLYRFAEDIWQLFKNQDYELIVISNSCYDTGLVNNFLHLHPHINFISNESNLGYARAINLGVAISKGQYLIVCNPLCFFKQFDIQHVHQNFIENPQLAVIGPEISDSKSNVRDSYRTFMLPINLLKRRFSKLLTSSKVDMQQSKPFFVDWVIGACMIIRKSAFDKIGGFDSNYFLYVEDMDFCYRVTKLGFTTLYEPKLKIIYNSNRRSTRGLNKYTLIHISSYLRFLKKFIQNR
ncbi:MAG: glycosyltransferase family 2 protein [Bacteroidales bacterium]|nr:glycosyltransferase family 2 protein [Bacteroidales bacterium]